MPTDEQETFSQVQRRDHPVRRLLDEVSAGSKPAPEAFGKVIAMAAPQDRAKLRQRLLEVTTEAYALRNEGALGRCRAVTRDAAFELAALTGPHRPPGEDLSALTPPELAARIGRGPGAVGSAR